MGMRGFRNAWALTVAALRSIPQRLGVSLVTVISITTVMAVLVSMLALGQGVEYIAQSNARADRASVVAKGSQSAMNSVLPRTALQILMDKPGIKRDAQGKPLLAGVYLTLIDAVTRQNLRDSVGFFASGSQWRAVWPEVEVVKGRYFTPGVNEIIVAERIEQRFKNFDIGDEVRTQGTSWKVVGIYRSKSRFFDNAVVADADTALAAFPQATYTSFNVVLESPASFDTLKKAIASDPTIQADLKTEADANESVVRGIRGVLDFVSYFIGSLMALGATCGALASLYAAVDSRAVEIATLRAIGFGATPVVISVLAEGLVLALPAALLGAGIAWCLFNGQMVVTNSISFPMTVTAGLVIVSLCWSLAIALIGGLLPSIRAAQLPVATALRQT